MDDQLLVRTYNVGLGDCIYIRVPDNGTPRHILIDCGNTDGDSELLAKALDHLSDTLAKEKKNKALDLLVVTHPHQDHIAGFGIHPDKFLALTIRNMWLSPSIDPDHRQAGKSLQLQAFAEALANEFTKLPLGAAFNDLARDLFGLSNKPALETLRRRLPEKNGYPNNRPTYVHDGAAPPSIFDDDKIHIRVLAPRNDIDGEYLGRIDEALHQLMGMAGMRGVEDVGKISANWDEPSNVPPNIGARDFRRLRQRLFKNALGFVLSSNELINNTSVILLLEWKGHRLLFTGDAQFRASRRGQYERGKPNGSWNAMWHHHKAHLDAPVDFLKVGHHGSHNATPWVGHTKSGDPHPINDVLDAIAPVGGRTEIVLSTERMKYPSIPDRELATELGKRAGTRRKYDEPKHLEGRMVGKKWRKYDPDEELVPKSVNQPLRTDLEHQRAKQEVAFIDVSFPKAK